MKDIKLTITIDKPVEEVFVFTLNPENIPKYVDSIVTEQTNEWPVKLGTIYRNQRCWGGRIVVLKRPERFCLDS